MKLKAKKKKGFTLIELVAVVAILAILAAVLVPSVSGYITRSRKAAIITQCREVVNAVETYNLTAASKIEKSATISSLTAENGSLVSSELLTADKVDKLGESITVETAEQINKDESAIDKIRINNDTHKFESYNEKKSK